MNAPPSRSLLGLESLEAATALLQRVRGADPVFGEFEAADLQWWWRVPRSTDELPDLFWYDDDELPLAAVVATAWEESVGLDVFRLPSTSVAWTSQLVHSALQHAQAIGLDSVDFVADQTDDSLLSILADHGFDQIAPETVQAWMSAVERPTISPLPQGYRLMDRSSTAAHRAHHLTARSGPDVERRLSQTSLYRPDLDLLLLDDNDEVAAYGLFWFDPVTLTGLVEPMRTEDTHRGQGLARHVLTAGVNRLAGRGAQQIKICYRPSNPTAAHLYRSAGFVPTKETVVVAAARSSPTRPV